MREGMSEGEFTMEKGRVPAEAARAIEILNTAEQISGQERRAVLEEQIDNLLEGAFDAGSGLSEEERKGIQDAAKNLKDELDREAGAWGKMKEELVEAGWFKEGEKGPYGAN